MNAVIPEGQPLPHYDFHASLQSLPRLFKTDLTNIPNRVPYLENPADYLDRWRPPPARRRAQSRTGLVRHFSSGSAKGIPHPWPRIPLVGRPSQRRPILRPSDGKGFHNSTAGGTLRRRRTSPTWSPTIPCCPPAVVFGSWHFGLSIGRARRACFAPSSESCTRPPHELLLQLGYVVGGDFLYDEQSPGMLQSGVLLKEIDELIATMRTKGPDGKLKRRESVPWCS